MQHPISWLDAGRIAHEVERALAAQYNRPNFIAKGHPTQAQSTTQTLKVQKVSPTKMEKRRKQDFCYYCDENTPPSINARSPNSFKLMLLITAHRRKPHHLRNQRRKKRTTSRTMYLKNQLSCCMLWQGFLRLKLSKLEVLLSIDQ